MHPFLMWHFSLVTRLMVLFILLSSTSVLQNGVVCFVCTNGKFQLTLKISKMFKLSNDPLQYYNLRQINQLNRVYKKIELKFRWRTYWWHRVICCPFSTSYILLAYATVNIYIYTIVFLVTTNTITKSVQIRGYYAHRHNNPDFESHMHKHTHSEYIHCDSNVWWCLCV